ncbi:lytic transglycosylase domain-containing protein [Agrobacterium rubi]|nr:lytic transglycosylase domain-containing protein [Agrobacterium rubi]NTF24420.1 lytic transglycosylase domain-containing protein [Agrobacterium rubi]
MLANLFSRAILAVALSVTITLASSPASAASWGSVRDRAMTLREQGRHTEAYKTAANFSGDRSEDLFDKEWSCGWIALQKLGRADLAVAHFTKAVSFIPGMKRDRQGVSKAKAGYWLGRALKTQGRTAEAQSMFKASMAYGTSFYGQLSASEMKAKLSKEQLASIATTYPVKDIYWHDNRARQELVLAVIREESRFKPQAESNKGAKGMMQVMDETARGIGRQAGVQVDVGLMSKNPDYNIAVGSRYLGDMLARYNGNAMLAAAAYNAGPLRVDEWLGRFGDPRGGKTDPVDWAESIPFRETREYVQKVMSSYITYLSLNQ